MCYDISFTVQVKDIQDYFPDLIFKEQLSINFTPDHIAGHAYAEHPVIFVNRETNQKQCNLMEWGCIPFYIKDESAFKKQRSTMLNARSEKILADSKSYWNKIRNRRCLIPVSGFYEHRVVEGFKNKIPYYISLKNEPLFFIAGLYSIANLPDKETGEMQDRQSFTIITTEANALLKMIHNGPANAGRMPLMLSRQLAEEWLKQEINTDQYQSILDFKMPVNNMQYTPVFTIRGNKSREDGELKNVLYDWPGLQPIVL